MGSAFRSKMYIDDGLCIELDLGTRGLQLTQIWAEAARGCVSKESINEEQNRVEGQWGPSQIFLGFQIEADNLAIRLPEQKRAGATVLFGALFASFGRNCLRSNNLQQERGNIEHFKSTNSLWIYFTAPIDARLGFGDEAGRWVMSANPDFRTAFWASVEVVRILRSSGGNGQTCYAGRLGDYYHQNNASRVSIIPSERCGCQVMLRWTRWLA